MLSIAFSPCPNDVYLFAGWWKAALLPQMPIQVTLGDIEELNRWALEKKYPLMKVSAALLPHLLQDYRLLPCGGALGHGVGPKVIAGPDCSCNDFSQLKVAFPGQHTTAYLLSQLFLPPPKETHFLRYDQLVEAVCAKRVDAAVIIHETRFTFASQGLREMVDLGALWQEATELPLPLGCLVASRRFSDSFCQRLTHAIQKSLRWARRHHAAVVQEALFYSQEKDARVVENHIHLFVNDETQELSKEGLQAFQALVRMSGEKGVTHASDLFCDIC